MEPAVLYLRYSDKNQQELSIEGQLRECTVYCERKELAIVGSYIDRAMSGKYETRNEFQRMVADAAKGQFKYVIVYKLNRFFRNRTEAAIYRKELRQHGVQLLSATEEIPQGRGGIFYEAILEAEAEAYSMGLSEDTMRGMHDAALNCQVIGPLPLGYRAGADKKLEIDPAEAAIVRRAFEMYADGASIAEICDTFNNEGLRTKARGRFRVSGISAIFKNVKYMGVYKYKDLVSVENGCPAIVSAELFAAVNRRMGISSQAPARGKATAEFFLSTKLFCGHCGGQMFGDSANRKGSRYYYYSCSAHRKQKTCDKKPVPKKVIEDLVLDAALQALTPENITKIAVETERVARAESKNGEIVAQLKRELAEVGDVIQNIGKAIAQGIITETTKDMLENAEAHRRDLRARIAQEQLISETVLKAEDVAIFLHKFAQGNRNDVDFKRKIFDVLVREVYVYDDKAVIWCNVGKGLKVEKLFGYSPKRGAKHKKQAFWPAFLC